MKHFLSAQYKQLLMRPVRETDLEYLRVWRNDKENTPYLKKLDYITPDMQAAWYKRDLTDEDCYTFAIEETSILNRLVGSMSLYNFKSTTAEFGRALIDPEARGKGLGFLATVMCLQIGFCKLNLDKIVAKVHEDNTFAIKAYEKSGFLVIGKHISQQGQFEIDIAVSKERFLKTHDFLPQIQILG